MPQVSVVTPYRNSSEFLREAITSVQQQTFRDWELLLVDDGSTDSSREIAEEASRSDPRIRSLERTSGSVPGAAAARNSGLAEITGDLVTFLDADDRLLPEKLATEVALMQRYPTAGLTCGGTLWWNPGHRHRNWSDEIRSLSPGLHEPPLLVNLTILLQRDHVPCLCAIMVRREALPSYPAFEPAFRLYEDQTFLTKMFAQNVCYVGRHITALYRQHSNATSALAYDSGDYRRLGQHDARTEFLAWARTYLENSAVRTSTAESVLLAEAIQQRDSSRLDRSQRAKLRRWAAENAIIGVPRRSARWLRRRWLQLRRRGPIAG